MTYFTIALLVIPHQAFIYSKEKKLPGRSFMSKTFVLFCKKLKNVHLVMNQSNNHAFNKSAY